MHIFRSPITAVFTFSTTINQAVFVKTTKLSHGFWASVLYLHDNKDEDIICILATI